MIVWPRACRVTLWSCFLLCLLFGLTSAAAVGGSTELSGDQQVVHILNRLGFGPRPGDIERVREIGVKAYIRQQLNPQEIEDSEIEARLSRFQNMKRSPRSLLEEFYELSDIDKKAKEEASRSNSGKPQLKAPRLKRQIQVELMQSKLYRAVYSERQLQEVMVDFWMNHFNIFFQKGLDWAYLSEFEYEVIRPHVLGNFEDLLVATAKSPAMLFYLDNWMSSAPAEEIRQRLDDLRGTPGGRRKVQQATAGAQYLRRVKGLNENYARELLELHTLGVEGGYSQEDVIQVARCFTGWTLQNPRKGSGFRFEPLMHEDGDKFVMGRKVPSSGAEEGLKVLSFLAEHPMTARFISTKLVRRFIADEPPAKLVELASDRFLESGGDIRAVLETILTSEIFLSPNTYQAKVKKPFELVASALRALQANVKDATSLGRVLAGPVWQYLARWEDETAQLIWTVSSDFTRP